MNCGHGLVRSYMPEDLRNQRWVLDTGNDPQLPATIGTGLDVDGEDALKALRPGHGCHGFSAVHRASRPLRDNAFSVLEVGRKDTMEASEVQMWIVF